MYFHPAASMKVYRKIMKQARVRAFLDRQLSFRFEDSPRTAKCGEWAVTGNTAHKCQK